MKNGKKIVNLLDKTKYNNEQSRLFRLLLKNAVETNSIENVRRQYFC